MALSLNVRFVNVPQVHNFLYTHMHCVLDMHLSSFSSVSLFVVGYCGCMFLFFNSSVSQKPHLEVYVLENAIVLFLSPDRRRCLPEQLRMCRDKKRTSASIPEVSYNFVTECVHHKRSNHTCSAQHVACLVLKEKVNRKHRGRQNVMVR